MANGYSIITVIGLIITLILICNSENIKEGYLQGYSLGLNVQQSTQQGNALSGSSIINTTQASPVSFYSTPNFQRASAPRFSSVGYGANISYNPPATSKLGTETHQQPTFMALNANITDESVKSFAKKMSILDKNVTKENYIAKCKQDNNAGPKSISIQGNSADDEFPLAITNKLGNLGSEMGIDGQAIPTVFINNLTYSSLRSRLQASGDMIRGDLPIVPCNNGWFNVAARPLQSLQRGALFAMAGKNTSSTDLGTFISTLSAGLTTSVGGGVMNTQSVMNTSNPLDSDGTGIKYSSYI